MGSLTRVVRTLRNLFCRRQVERDLDEEIQASFDLLVEEKTAAGLSPADARRASRLEFGGPEIVKELVREARASAALDQIARDSRHAVRMLRRTPAFTTAAVGCLALGIGANIAVFGLLDNLLLRRLPDVDAEGLVSVHSPLPDGGLDSWFPGIAYERLRDENDVFTTVVGWMGTNVPVSAKGSPPDMVRVGFYPGDYYAALGVRPRLGRAIALDDDKAGRPLVAVISDRYWRASLAGDPAVLDQVIDIRGVPARIVGVGPPGFTGLFLPALSPKNLSKRDNSQDIGLPAAWYARITGSSMRQVNIAARLKADITLEQATAETTGIISRALHDSLDAGLAPEERHEILSRQIVLRSAARGDLYRWDAYRTRTLVLMSAVAIVLVVSCANLANLLLVRASARQREMAVRLALGAGPARLMRQLVVESFILAAIGGAAGCLIAMLVRDGLSQTLGLGRDLPFNWRVFSFGGAISLASAMLVGLIPAWRSTRVDLTTSFKPRPILFSSRRFGTFRARTGLVVAQIALSLFLIINAALLVHTLRNLEAAELGFDPENVLLAWMYPDARTYEAPARVRLYEQVLQRFGALSGVVSASIARHDLMQGADDFAVVSHASGAPTRSAMNWISPGFFGTMRVPMLAGRDFAHGDTGSARPVAIVDRTFAAQQFGATSPLGRRITIRMDAETWEAEIVGVAGNTRNHSLQNALAVPSPQVYLPFTQASPERIAQMCVAVRTREHPMRVLPALKREAQAADRGLPLVYPTTQADVLRDSIREARSLAMLTTVFGLVAVGLACVGLYGVMSYLTMQRTSELGLRLALGATRANVLWLVLRESLVVAAAGIVVGLPAAVASSRLLSDRLFGVGGIDPGTTIGAVLLMGTVVTLAGFVPARRASNMEPGTGLRCE